MLRTLLAAAFLALLPLIAPAAPEAATPPTADGRAATVVDRQGSAFVRPAGRDRWTPLTGRAVLLPGDTLRTDARGANALELELASGGRLVLGPGSLLELSPQGGLNLLAGDLDLTPGPAAIPVTGPGGFVRRCDGPIFLRAGGNATEQLAQPPRWLTGYRSSTTGEWLGSLLAKIDGRDVPLHIGYHKVQVTIRDQVAETTVEQSFVNGSDSILEGVFRFPLPPDAAVSGFGMWIGEELVEADVVEKTRARAIYQEILARKKDPGLLEWSGGNLFQASVYPIPAKAEKRVRIRYTQVLPKEGDRLRYRYALRSELLRTHPLRELRIDVAAYLGDGVAGVSSSTHAVQAQHGERTATVAFAAQEYTPTQDFEIALQVARPEAVTAVSHVVDREGWFLLLLAPPDEAAQGWQRVTVPESAPLDLIVVADTSGSMEPGARAAQADFIGALLQSLGGKDRFRLLCADARQEWLQVEPRAADDAGRAAALEFLLRRRSLGWTDLDAAMAAVTAVSTAASTVVYVGDGIHTAGDADAAALAARLRGLAGKGRFHAVSTGSSFDQVALTALASNGGSLRDASADPAAAALGLLQEAAGPGLRNVRVQIEGVATAAVYPDVLPNLPLGRQQVVLGRFQPGGEGSARVTVRGVLDGAPASYEAELALRPAEGNPFLPRLWARARVEALLAAGGGGLARDEIIALGERFRLVTPFTSLLVLESDADREEFGVQRRVAADDGERLFAAARDAAATEKLRAAMAAAGSWRRGLRLAALREIRGLGKDLYPSLHAEVAFGEVLRSDRGIHAETRSRRSLDAAKGDWGFDGGGVEAATAVPGAGGDDMFLGRRAANDDLGRLGEPEAEATVAEDARNFDDDFLQGGPTAGRPAASPAFEPAQFAGEALAGKRIAIAQNVAPGGGSDLGFPRLAGAAAEPPRGPDPVWPEAALTLLRSLDRRSSLQAAADLRLVLVAEPLHPVTGAPGPRTVMTLGLRAGAWALIAGEHEGRQWHWADGGTRGVVDAAGLGRARPAVAADQPWALVPVGHLALHDAVRELRFHEAAVTERVGHVQVTLTGAGDERRELDIDTQAQVLREQRVFQGGRLRSRLTCTDFVEVAGRAWPRLLVWYDDQGRVTQRTTLAFAEGEAGAVFDEVQAQRQGAVLLTGDGEVEAARERLHGGSATLTDHLVLLLHAAGRDRWGEVLARLTAAEPFLTGRRGATWLRLRSLVAGRRHQELAAVIDAIAVAGPAEAELLWAAVHGVLGDREKLLLLDRLQAQFTAAGDDATARRRRWQQRRAQHLENVDPAAAAVAWAGIAAGHPADLSSQTGLAQFLARVGRTPDAIVVLRAALAGAGWSRTERDHLYILLTDRLWDLRDLAGLAAATQAWIDEVPGEATAWIRWVAVRLFQGGDVDAWLRDVAAAPWPDAPDEAQRARLTAALQTWLGSGWNWWTQQLDPAAAAALAAQIRRLAANKAGLELAAGALADWRFRRTPAFVRLQVDLRQMLLADGAVTGMDLGRLEGLVRAVSWGVGDCSAAEWQSLRDALHRRWQDTEAQSAQDRLATLLFHLFDQRSQQANETGAALAFARAHLDRAEPVFRPKRARLLFARLLQAEWQEALQTEVLAMLPAQADPWDDRHVQDLTMAHACRTATDTLAERRRTALLGPVAELEKLPRTERRLREAAARGRAFAGLARALAAAAAPLADQQAALVRIEALCCAVQGATTGEECTAAAREALALLHAVVAQEPALWPALRERCSLVAAYAAVLRKAPAELADAVLTAYRTGQQGTPDLLDWRRQEIRLLLALDRAPQLAERLAAWIAPARVDRDLRALLGLLLAEQGDLRAACAQFERIAADGELRAGELAALADWRLVLGEDDRREAALEARAAELDENALYREVNAARSRLRDDGSGVPANLDGEAVRSLRWLLRKSQAPHNQLWLAERLYLPTKDHRVLQVLADGVPGHSVEAVYAFLRGAHGLIAQVHEEPALDALLERIAAVEAGAAEAPLSPQDRRALALLRALALHRAAQVPDAPARRATDALAALRTALASPADPVEIVPLAEFLATIAPLPGEAGALLLTAVASLGDDLPRAGLPRLTVAQARARVRWQQGERDAALQGLIAALADLAAGDGGRLPFLARAAVEEVGAYARESGQHSRVEAILRDQERLQPPGSMRAFVIQQLHGLYLHAIRHDGTTTLGRGKAGYVPARDRLIADLMAAPPPDVPDLVQHLSNLHDRAITADAGADLLAFAQGPLQELLPRLPAAHADVLQRVARHLHELGDPRGALELLVARIRTEPSWHHRVGKDGWSEFAHDLARFRAAVRDRGDHPELRQIVLAALERALRAGHTSPDSFWRQGRNTFWASERGSFVAVAHKVLADTTTDAEVQLAVARYLWDGLVERRPAVEVLVQNDGRGILTADGRGQLARWLLELRRPAEAIPHLQRLLADRPDVLDHRTALVVALHGAGQDAAAREMATATIALWAERQRLSADNAASIAKACADAELFDLAAAQFTLAIRERERQQRLTPSGDRRLAEWYGGLAQAESAQDHHLAAVDAAAAAVLFSGGNQARRKAADEALLAILGAAGDLQALLDLLDRRAAADGADSPVLRKALGEVLTQRGALDAALAQYRLAAELQPADADLPMRMVALLDRMDRPADAVALLLDFVTGRPRDAALTLELANRFAALGAKDQAERARTQLAEGGPDDVDGHRELARVRGGQGRHRDAVQQWLLVTRARPAEPAGFLDLARAQAAGGAVADARATLRTVLGRTWNPRFGAVHDEAQAMLRRLDD